MRKVIVVLSLLLTTAVSAVFGQTNKQYSISGRLIDADSRVPVEFASVAVYTLPDTVLVTGVMSNAKGEFIIGKLNPGNYVLKSNYIGYKTFSKTVNVKDQSVSLSEPFYMKNTPLSIGEVVVTGTQRERQSSIEKTKINVTKNIASVSGNITDVLKNQASINVDIDDNVYIRGNKNTLILMDGVPSTISSLNSIPASNVESIEIITNPDVKYDAEGTGGIINIVTKRQGTSGLSGRAIVNYGFNNRINGGLNLHYTKGIWDVDLNYTGKYEKANIESNLTRFLYSRNLLVEQDIHSVQINKAQTATMFLTAKPNKTEIYTLGAKFVTPELFNTQNIAGKQIEEGVPAIPFNRVNDITFSRKLFESTFSYKKMFERNRNELSVDASFSKTRGNRPARYYIEDVLLQKSSGGGSPTITTLQTDYLKSVSRTGKIETGVKGFFRWNNFNNNFYDMDQGTDQWIINPAFSNDLEHKENIYSAYLMYSDSLSQKLFYKIGGRVEYNTTDIRQKSITEKIYNEYWYPFPFLMIKYDINQSNNIALSLNRRITRPTYPQIIPFINVIDQMTLETGNKNLQPEILDKVEMNYSFVKEKFQFKTNIFASTTKDFITQVSSLSPPDKLILTYVNGKRQNVVGGDIDIAYKFNKYISVNPAFSVFQTISKGNYNGIDLSTNDWAWTGNIKASIRPEKKTELMILFNYDSPVALPQFHVSENYYVDIAVKRTFLDNKVSATITLTDVFDTRRWRTQSDNNVFRLRNYNKIESRILWVSLTYSFNSYKINNGRSQKNSENEGDSGIIKLGQ